LGLWFTRGLGLAVLHEVFLHHVGMACIILFILGLLLLVIIGSLPFTLRVIEELLFLLLGGSSCFVVGGEFLIAFLL